MSAILPKIDALCARYGVLLQALAPEIRGFILTAPTLAARAVWGEGPGQVEALLEPTGWSRAKPDPDAQFETAHGADARLLALPLLSDSGRLLGAAVLVWPVADGPDAATLASRVGPALECLRHEISATEAALGAMDLQWQQVTTQLHRDHVETDTVDALLQASLARSGCHAALLYVPNRGIAVMAREDEGWMPDVETELDGLRARLRGLAGSLNRPLVLQGPSRSAGQSSACRLLIVPTRCCAGRLEVLVAFLNPLLAPGFSPQQVMLLQSAAAAAARRLDLDLDPQTGLLNRNGLEQVLGQLGPGVGSLLLVDIDQHRRFNQTHGVPLGDAAITRIAALLVPPLLPKRTYAARLQGGTFALLAPGMDTGTARALAASVQDAVAAIDLGDDGRRVGLTVSCGIARIRSLGAPLADALVPAEAVLRAAKERGRPGIEVHVPDRTVFDDRRDQALAAAGLREALRNAQIVLFAQKIVSSYDPQKTTGYELLVRMKDPFTGRLLEPGEFLTAAHNHNLLPAMDRHIVEEAFNLLGQHRALLTHVELRVSINVSGSSLRDPAFADFFIDRLRQSRVPPGQITVEVTEKAAMASSGVVADTLNALRAAGCGIALDDFGKAGQPLSNLRTMPVTHIKIDGSFVNDILTNPLAESAVRGIVNFSRDLNLNCVAECVETAQVLARLRQLGVQHVQGYAVGRPAPIEDAFAAMEQSRLAEMAVILNL